MINKHHFRELISDTLKQIDHLIPYSDNAVELLMMTAAHESHLGTWLKQHVGPARGIFQIEPATQIDTYNNYMKYRPEFMKTINDYATEVGGDLQYNLQYQVVLARIIYYRAPKKLPTTTVEMAEYAKEFWNTEAGKATVEDYLSRYNKYAL